MFDGSVLSLFVWAYHLFFYDVTFFDVPIGYILLASIMSCALVRLLVPFLRR